MNIYKNIYKNADDSYYTSASITNDYISLGDYVSSNYDFFPLSSDFNSIKGKHPYKMIGFPRVLLDKDPNFNYNSKTLSYNYEARGTTLIYDVRDILNYQESEHINSTFIKLDFYMCTQSIDQTLIEASYNTNTITVGINKDNYLTYRINDLERVTSFKVNLFTLYKMTLGLSGLLTVIIGNENIISIPVTLNSPNTLLLYVGCSSDDNYFYGQLSNLIISRNMLYINNDIIKKIEEYNELDMIVSNKIVKNNNIILSNYYKYESINDRIIPRINKEKINNDTYTYTYQNNKVSSIKKNNTLK